MMLAAHEIGLGTCWIHREREMKENLKDYGWSINPPSTRKERKRDPELFETP